MKRVVWGPYIWRLLHCFTMRIKDEYFIEERKNIINYITSICDNLPCPNCSLHSTQYLKKHNFKFIKNKDNLIQIILNLHNDVNKRTNKEYFKKEQLSNTYDKYDFKQLIISYIKMSNSINYTEKMMLYTFRRKEFLKKILQYFKENIHKYDIIVETK